MSAVDVLGTTGDLETAGSQVVKICHVIALMSDVSRIASLGLIL